MKAALTQRAYLDWHLYWEVEPWGPYRDNLHTALLAREIRRPQVARHTVISSDDFMVKPAVERRAKRKTQMLSLLRGISVPVKRHD